MTKLLIKNAAIVSMDPAIGDLEDADLLVIDSKIAAVERNISADDAEVIDGAGKIVIPGLINAHIHTWETSLRGIGGDWVSVREYQANVHGNLATRYGPEDNYIGNFIGAMTQLAGGATTIFDWCHNLVTPEMADRSIDALEDVGIRAVFGFAAAKAPNEPGQPHYSEIAQPANEVRRLRNGRLSSDDAMISMAMGILGPDWGTYDVSVKDITLARELGIFTSAHTWGRPPRKAPDGMWKLNDAGLLGDDHNIVHGCFLEDDELKMCVDAGCTFSCTSRHEVLNSTKLPLVGRLEDLGATPSIGSDIDIAMCDGMFSVMRTAFLVQRQHDSATAFAAGEWPLSKHKTKTRSALNWATMGGAKALKLDHKIGSLTPGKQADIVIVNANNLGIFPALPLGDPVQALFYTETADVETVMVNGRIVKSDGKLLYPESEMKKKQQLLFESRERIMREGDFVYADIRERF